MATRADIEGELIDSLGPKLVYVGLNGVTRDGTNTSLNGPIRKAIQSMGVVTTNFTVQDSDLASFTGYSVEKLIDFAKLEALTRIGGRCTEVNYKADMASMALSDFHDQVMAEIECLEDRLREPYGPAIPPPSIGTMQEQGMGEPPRIVNDPMAPWFTRSRPGRWPYP